MKKMMAMLLASVMAAGTFTTTAFAYMIFFFFFLCKQWFNKSRNPLSVCIQAPCYPFFLIQFFQGRG